jgi:hypothetical protein
VNELVSATAFSAFASSWEELTERRTAALNLASSSSIPNGLVT